VIRAALTFLTGLAMLLPTDTGAIQNSGLRPAAQSALNGPLSVRTAVVQTLQYQTYTTSGDNTILSFTFPAGTLVAGNQVRLHAYGVATNTSGANKSFTPSTHIIQSTNLQSAGVLFQIPNGGAYAWQLDGEISFSSPGPAGSFDPTLKVPVPSAKPNDMLAVGSMVQARMETAPTTVTEDFAVVADPNVLLVNNYAPVTVTLQLNIGVNVSVTVVGGWIEAM
jgi:hypothetical protein